MLWRHHCTAYSINKLASCRIRFEMNSAFYHGYSTFHDICIISFAQINHQFLRLAVNTTVFFFRFHMLASVKAGWSVHVHVHDMDRPELCHDYVHAAKFSNMTSVGKNLNFNQVHGCFMLPPSSFFFNYALLSKIE